MAAVLPAALDLVHLLREASVLAAAWMVATLLQAAGAVSVCGPQRLRPCRHWHNAKPLEATAVEAVHIARLPVELGEILQTMKKTPMPSTAPRLTQPSDPEMGVRYSSLELLAVTQEIVNTSP